MGNEYYGTISPMGAKLLEVCLILFFIMIVLTLISIILNIIKRKDKKRTIYQVIISVVTLIGSFYIVGYSIRLFGGYSDLYTGLVILIIGNILTLINIFKK